MAQSVTHDELKTNYTGPTINSIVSWSYLFSYLVIRPVCGIRRKARHCCNLPQNSEDLLSRSTLGVCLPSSLCSQKSRKEKHDDDGGGRCEKLCIRVRDVGCAALSKKIACWRNLLTLWSEWWSGLPTWMRTTCNFFSCHCWRVRICYVDRRTSVPKWKPFFLHRLLDDILGSRYDGRFEHEFRS